jgi:hypothetical protein
MTAVVHFVAIVCVLVLAGSGPVSAWWQYAEWGLSDGQIRTASSGHAVPCRPDAPVCASTPSGQLRFFVESLKM